MANEKRNLIDRDELIDSLGISDMEIFAKEVIGDAPLVDAVEVVRCAECRSLNMTGYDEDNAQITDHLLQSGFCEMWGKDTQLCNFCSYGERREGE